jgi:predicted GNAT family N-acyltransferase
MLTVQLADFHADNEAIRSIRFSVFVDEQKVPAELEMDDRDAACIHVLARADDRPIGTGRIDTENQGKIGRVAVAAGSRRHGVGTALMQRLHRVARDRGLASVWCHAQVSSLPFYERLGYSTLGDVFDEAGIPHVRMELKFAVSGDG